MCVSYEHWSCRESAAPSLNYVFKLLSAVPWLPLSGKFLRHCYWTSWAISPAPRKADPSDSRLWWRKVWLSRENGQFMIKRPSGKVVCLFAFLIGRKLLYGVVLFFCCTMQMSHNYTYSFSWVSLPPRTPPLWVIHRAPGWAPRVMQQLLTSRPVLHKAVYICQCYFLH